MPSRKSVGGSSEDTNNEKASTLRRLSSITSFHGIFSRRRSQFPSSCSNLSLASTLANPPVPQKRLPPTAIDPLVNQAITQSISGKQASPSPFSTPRPLQAAQQNGSEDYIELSDEVSYKFPHEISHERKPPRSRTFSNLPLPVRSNKAIQCQGAKADENRSSFAERSQHILPATRLPTPTASTRRYSQGRFPSFGRIASLVPSKTRMQRSDTEPLLSAFEPDNRCSLILAKKENVALNAAQRLSMVSICEDDRGELMSATKFGPKEPFVVDGPRKSNGGRKVHLLPSDIVQTQSSPPPGSTKRGQTTNTKTTSERMQRWISQPILANVTNRRSSRHGEIKHTRLLAVRQAPTPPLPKTPLLSPAISKESRSALSLRSSRTRTHTPFSSPRLGTEQARLLSPEGRKQAPKVTLCITHPETHQNQPTSKLNQVLRAESSSYWAGRLTSLMDQYRNAELMALLETDYFSGKAKAERERSARSDVITARFRRAFAQLHEFCLTSDARHSLVVFQRNFAEMAKLPDLIAVPPPKAIERMSRLVVGGGARKKAGGDGGELGGENAKGNIVGRFLDKQKSRSLVLL